MSNHRDGCLSSHAVGCFGQLISPVVGDLFQYQTAACACLVCRQATIIDRLVLRLNRPSEEVGEQISHVCRCSCEILPVMLWCDELYPKNPIDNVSHLATEFYGFGRFMTIFEYKQNSRASVSGSWLLTGIIHLFLWGQMKGEVITLVPGLQTPEER